MIEVNKGEIKITGSKGVISAEFAILVHALYENEILSKEEIEKHVDLGFKTKEELKEIDRKKQEQFENKLEEIMKEIFN